MTEAQKNAIASPTEGLMIYQNNNTKGFQYWNGTAWTTFGAGATDNFGDHIADMNIQLDDHWLSNDGGNEGIRIDDNGNVGIGSSAPSQKLQIQVNNNGLNLPLFLRNYNGTASGGNGVGIGFNSEQNGDWIKGAIFHERTAGFGIGKMHFLLDNTGDASSVTISDASMTITPNKTVGIGTRNPAANLHLYGDGVSGLVLTGTSTSSNPREGAELGFSAGGFYAGLAASIQLVDYDGYSGGLAFNVHKGTNNGAGGTFADNWPTDVIQAMTIVNNGKVGIGTADPQTLLHVAGTTRINDLAGTGTRMVVASNNGTLSTQALPTSGSTPTTVEATSDATINPASYSAGSVSGMSISSVAAGTYLVTFNADIERNGSTACQCVVRAGGSDDLDTERKFEIPAARSQFNLMGKVTLASTGTIEIRCRKTSGGAGFKVGKRALTIQLTN